MSSIETDRRAVQTLGRLGLAGEVRLPQEMLDAAGLRPGDVVQAIVAHRVTIGFAPAPVDLTKSSGWLWSWALALESASKNKSAAWQFMSWATSKEYIAYDASKNGWAAVPPGTRTSTYNNPQYLAAASAFAPLTLQEIDSVNITQPGVSPQPVPGVQYVGIPEFEEFGALVSAQITAAIDGQETVAQALSKSQQIWRRTLASPIRRPLRRDVARLCPSTPPT